VPSNIFLQATPSAIVGISLDNQPDFYIFLSDVVVVFLERVKVSLFLRSRIGNNDLNLISY
jgi:hypothetical protein